MIIIFILIELKPYNRNLKKPQTYINKTPFGDFKSAVLPIKRRSIPKATLEYVENLNEVIPPKNSQFLPQKSIFCSDGFINRTLMAAFLNCPEIFNLGAAVIDDTRISDSYYLTLSKKARRLYIIGEGRPYLALKMLEYSGTPVLFCNAPPSEVPLLNIADNTVYKQHLNYNKDLFLKTELKNSAKRLYDFWHGFSAYETLPLAAAVYEQWNDEKVLNFAISDLESTVKSIDNTSTGGTEKIMSDIILPRSGAHGG